MDRRQRKSREAIFKAFTALLSEKNYSHISVQEIIDKADVGRTTFYAHFETKEFLLKQLCQELFDHIIQTAMGQPHSHSHGDGRTDDSIFLHLLRHLQEDDRNILGLLSSQNNDIFLRYFKNSLDTLVRTQVIAPMDVAWKDVPEDFLVNHISGSFVEMVQWWIKGGRKESPERLTEYFMAVMGKCQFDSHGQ